MCVSQKVRTLTVKTSAEISQNFLAFSEYKNFKRTGKISQTLGKNFDHDNLLVNNGTGFEEKQKCVKDQSKLETTRKIKKVCYPRKKKVRCVGFFGADLKKDRD